MYKNVLMGGIICGGLLFLMMAVVYIRKFVVYYRDQWTWILDIKELRVRWPNGEVSAGQDSETELAPQKVNFLFRQEWRYFFRC